MTTSWRHPIYRIFHRSQPGINTENKIKRKMLTFISRHIVLHAHSNPLINSSGTRSVTPVRNSSILNVLPSNEFIWIAVSLQPFQTLPTIFLRSWILHDIAICNSTKCACIKGRKEKQKFHFFFMLDL